MTIIIAKNHYRHRISTVIIVTSLTLILSTRTVAGSHITCRDYDGPDRHAGGGSAVLKFKLIAIASVLCAGAIGVCIPILGKRYEILRPENDIFFMIKAFAAGVILATGFIHILPEAFRTLTSPCLDEGPWQKFPFAGFISMMSAVATLMVDTLASGFYNRVHFGNKSNNKLANAVVDDEEEANNGHHGDDDVDGHDHDDDGHDGHMHVHTHATHGHAHGAAVPSQGLEQSELLRQRVISQVLELGILVHSVIIGVSLGASKSLETIKPLMAALSFHQFFEGIGLGGCISQAKFESMTTSIMMLFFSLTTPIGMGVGIAISSAYKENSQKALIVEGIFGSASSGILIYMALVDLLAADFMNPRMQRNVRLQLGAYSSLLLGVGCMSFLARWA